MLTGFADSRRVSCIFTIRKSDAATSSLRFLLQSHGTKCSVQRLWQLAVGLATWMPGFNLRPVHVGFVMYKLEMGQFFFLEVVQLFPVISLHGWPLLIDSSISDAVLIVMCISQHRQIKHLKIHAFSGTWKTWLWGNSGVLRYDCFDILLTVHLNIFILISTNLMH